MSDFFSESILAAAAGRTVRTAMLVLLDFTSGPERLWSGAGTLVTKDGNIWKGIGDLGSIAGLDQAINGTAPECTITLSGVDPQVSAAAANSFAEARGRAFTIYLQFFDDVGALLDSPAPIGLLTMERLEVHFTGPQARDVVVHAENMFSARGFPIHGWLSDLDQQARYPGDRGCERIPILQNYAVTWPPA